MTTATEDFRTLMLVMIALALTTIAFVGIGLIVKRPSTQQVQCECVYPARNAVYR